MDSDSVLGWLVLYKVATLASGCFFCLIGYKLFTAGHGSGESGVSLGYSRWNLSLTRVAPGVIFMLAGVGIIVATVVRGIGVHHAASPNFPAVDLPAPNIFSAPSENTNAPVVPSSSDGGVAPAEPSSPEETNAAQPADQADEGDALPPTLDINR